jgi:cytochrome c-type biogenesis protein CcmE
MGHAPWGKAIRMGGLVQGRLGSDGPLVARKVLDKHDENPRRPRSLPR